MLMALRTKKKMDCPWAIIFEWVLKKSNKSSVGMDWCCWVTEAGFWWSHCSKIRIVKIYKFHPIAAIWHVRYKFQPICGMLMTHDPKDKEKDGLPLQSSLKRSTTICRPTHTVLRSLVMTLANSNLTIGCVLLFDEMKFKKHNFFWIYAYTHSSW